VARAEDVIRAMEACAPPALAVEGDPVGLRAGSHAQPVRRVLLALDASPATVAEARRRGAQMLLTHHPPFYRGLSSLQAEEPDGALAGAILNANLVVYSAHTNLDAAPGGVADVLADAAGMGPERAPLQVTRREPFLKLTAFVPAGALEKVRRAVCAAGAGRYGAYSQCTFGVRGTGTFLPGAGARPYLGRAGRLEEADEYRLETRLRERDRAAVEAALRKSHPYEMPAYDFTRLDESIDFGLGRVGDRAEAVRLGALADALARRLRAPGVQVHGAPGRRVRRLAVWTGQGAPLAQAARAGAQVLVTGECGYHEAQDAPWFGLSIVRLGHGASERPVLAPLARRLRGLVPGVRFSVSRDRAALFRNL